jgi:hypothetical protein
MIDDEGKLITEGRRLKKEIDDDYALLRLQLTNLGTLKRSILSKESALRSIQDRLLASSGMPSPSEDGKARRRRMIQATDDDDFSE